MLKGAQHFAPSAARLTTAAAARKFPKPLLLGGGEMVSHLTLDQAFGVRVPASQNSSWPESSSGHFAFFTQ
jgi:hypothetical protein